MSFQIDVDNVHSSMLSYNILQNDTQFKVRHINGFEKFLFSAGFDTHETKVTKRKPVHSSRFIYMRDAMRRYRNTMRPLTLADSYSLRGFYLPKIDFVKYRAPVWTIKNRYAEREVYYQPRPTVPGSDDKYKQKCDQGWTIAGCFKPEKVEQKPPYYDTRRYKEVSSSCTRHTIIIDKCSAYVKHAKRVKHRKTAKTDVVEEKQILQETKSDVKTELKQKNTDPIKPGQSDEKELIEGELDKTKKVEESQTVGCAVAHLVRTHEERFL
ncbi:unnamed protein product [Didymodactylos carnosus]|uniref:Uncharacterized protein n=1 Tax=Didymodactylos carnosus TaxID=1234261 RepID=A0A815YYN1_9BILA|nr:unnamed protein product [Didymodactylos carnosus]CAF4441826.1 unnamed protein product [Didymodactylos carnosus]